MRPLFTVKYIVIHHTATPDDGFGMNMEAIRNYHINNNGWEDIGYHFIIEKIQNRYEILVGRMPSYQGAHCLGLNSKSIGVALIGNFNESPPPQEQWQLALKLVRSLMAIFKVPKDNVIGHREVNRVLGRVVYRGDCPGRLFDMDKFRAEL